MEQGELKLKRKRRTSAQIEKERLEWEERFKKKYTEIKNRLQKEINQIIIPLFNQGDYEIKIISAEIEDMQLNVGSNIANIYLFIKFTSKDKETENNFRKKGFYPYFLLSPFYSLVRKKLREVYNQRVGVSQEQMNYKIIPFS